MTACDQWQISVCLQSSFYAFLKMILEVLLFLYCIKYIRKIKLLNFKAIQFSTFFTIFLQCILYVRDWENCCWIENCSFTTLVTEKQLIAVVHCEFINMASGSVSWLQTHKGTNYMISVPVCAPLSLYATSCYADIINHVTLSLLCVQGYYSAGTGLGLLCSMNKGTSVLQPLWQNHIWVWFHLVLAHTSLIFHGVSCLSSGLTSYSY